MISCTFIVQVLSQFELITESSGDEKYFIENNKTRKGEAHGVHVAPVNIENLVLFPRDVIFPTKN